MQLAPELRRWLSSDDAAEPSRVQEEPFSAFRMLDVISRFLLRVAERCGRIPQEHELDDDCAPSAVDAGAALVLVLEDLHLADPDALQLVEVLCKAISSAPLLLVASYRSLEGWELSVLQAAREGALPNAQSWQLEGLTAEDVRCWARDCLPHAPLAIGETLYGTAEGHPLMTANLVHNLLHQDEPTLSLDTAQPQDFLARSVNAPRLIPERVADSFRRRFAKLRSPELELLQTASVFGDEALLSLLARVTEQELADVLRLLHHPARQGLVRQENNFVLRFSHRLVREVLYRDLDPGRRFWLHAAIPQVIASSQPGDRSASFVTSFVERTDTSLMFWLHTAIDPPETQWSDVIDSLVAWRRKATSIPSQSMRHLIVTDGGAPNASQHRALQLRGLDGKPSRMAVVTTVLGNPIKRSIATTLVSLNPMTRFFEPHEFPTALEFLELAHDRGLVEREFRILAQQLPPNRTLRLIEQATGARVTSRPSRPLPKQLSSGHNAAESS